MICIGIASPYHIGAPTDVHGKRQESVLSLDRPGFEGEAFSDKTGIHYFPSGRVPGAFCHEPSTEVLSAYPPMVDAEPRSELRSIEFAP